MRLHFGPRSLPLVVLGWLFVSGSAPAAEPDGASFACIQPEPSELSLLLSRMGEPSDCSLTANEPDPAWAPGPTYEIPVVVHIIDHGGFPSRVDDADVLRQLDALNEAFTELPQPSGPPIDTGIRFRLAQVDPNGVPTNGITRTVDSEWFIEPVSGPCLYCNDLIWDPRRYVNVVVNQFQSNFGGRIYVFPASGAAVGSPIDRISIDHQAFGGNSHIMAHELGHFLGLYHTFGGGLGNLQACGVAIAPGCYATGDLICDTLPDDGLLPTPFSCDHTVRCGNSAPYDNFMSYARAFCIDRFTPEQVLRMRCSLLSYRAGLLSAPPPPAGPAAPSDLSAELASGEVILAWVDNATDEEEMRVYRSVGGGGFALYETLPADSTQFVDSSILSGTSYRYRVTAWAPGVGESGPSNTVGVETPAVALEVELTRVGSGPIEAGELVAFEAAVTGAVESVDWQFGAEGWARAETPCRPGVFCTTYVFLAPIASSVSVEVIGLDGQRATASLGVDIVGDPADFAVERLLIPSVITGARGGDERFRSDLWLRNDSATPALADLAFWPRGGGGGPAASGPAYRRLLVPAGETLLVADLLTSIFDRPTAQGALMIAVRWDGDYPQRPVRVISRGLTVSGAASGTSYGQFVGPVSESSWSAEDRRLTGILDGDGFVATLQAANVGDGDVRVEITLIDGEGRPVPGRAVFPLGARGNRFQRLDVLFPEAVARPGPFTARFSSDGGPFVASATLLDTGSDDQRFLIAEPPIEPNPTLQSVTDDSLLLPRVVAGAGQFGTRLASSLTVYNPSPDATELRLQLWRRGQDNRGATEVVQTVEAGRLWTVSDLLGELFGVDEGAGAVRIEWSNPSGIAPIFQSFGLTEPSATGAGVRFGMRVPTLLLSESQSVAASERSLIVDRGSTFGAERSDRLQASFGAVNLNPDAVRLRLSVVERDGTAVAETEVVLKALQHLERNLAGIFPGLGSGSAWTVEVEVVGGGAVIAYLANINQSGDVFFVPANPTP